MPGSAHTPPWPEGLVEAYPSLASLPDALRALAWPHQLQMLSVPAGTLLFEEQAPCQGFPLVLSGEVRVARGSTQGRSLELYRVGPGELCVVSACGLFGSAPLAAHGVALGPTRLLLLSPAGFEQWVAHAPFRRFVFGVFADRLAELMAWPRRWPSSGWTSGWRRALLGHGPTVHDHAPGAGRRAGHRARDRDPAAQALRARRLGQPGARTHRAARRCGAARPGRPARPEPG